MANDLVRRISALIESREGVLVGPGAQTIRAAHAALRRIAARPPIEETIAATVPHRRVPGDDGGVTVEPAIVRTPARLDERRSPGVVLGERTRSLVNMARELERRRAEVEPLAARLRAGVASPAERLFGRALSREIDRAFALGNGESAAESAASEGAEPDPDQLPARVRELVAQMLDQGPSGSALRLSSLRVPETAFHDFATYVFLRDPNALIGPTDQTDVPGMAQLDAFLAQARAIIGSTIQAYCKTEIAIDKYNAKSLIPLFPVFEATLYRLFAIHVGGALFELGATLEPGYTGTSGDTFEDVLAVFGAWLRLVVTNASFNPDSLETSFDAPTLWASAFETHIRPLFFQTFPSAHVTTFVNGVGSDYGFSPFPLNVVNFGLRVVYRQEWRPLGTQPGEIVRTIPLGPKQVERITTKVVVHDKIARTAETTTSREVASESASATKDSTDVVREASKKLSWHAEVEASATFGAFGGNASAGAAGESAASSKETKTRLNETMQKTASRMTESVKVVVSTEHDTTEELSRSSEIMNPNDEVAITYVFSKLQRQYEIQTRMAEVVSVVFVPERVPLPSEIDAQWVGRHDWILAKVLLDESFAGDLAEVARGTPEQPVADDALFRDTADTARTSLADYKAFTGGALPDVFSAAQAGYERHIERRREASAALERWQRRERRLLEHLRANILHYMRAIWSSEDADQRMRRYARILVPVRWTFVPGSGDDGEFVPDMSPGSLRHLPDVLNPAGPIGHAGNYAIFYMRSDPRLVDLNGALAMLRAQYVRCSIAVSSTSSSEAYDRVAIEPRREAATYRLERTAGGWSAEDRSDPGTPVSVPITTSSDREVLFEGIRLRFAPPPATGDRFTVELRVGSELEDPEVRALRIEQPLPPPSEQATLFTPALLSEMGSYLPELSALLPADLSGGFASLTPAAQALVRDTYHQFLVLREHTRRFLMETNNLLLDLEVGATPILEDFKRLHRSIDVLKELEESVRRQLENSRRDRRLVANQLGDPEIEQVTVIAPGTVDPVIDIHAGGGGGPNP